MSTDVEPLPTCQGGCGHRLRPYRTTRKDYPGTRQHKGRGLCATCWRAEDPLTPPRQRHPMPKHCVNCTRLLRRRGTPKEKAAPGSVIFAARGLCTGCYAADRAGTVSKPTKKIAEKQRLQTLDPVTASNVIALKGFLARRGARRAPLRRPA